MIDDRDTRDRTNPEPPNRNADNRPNPASRDKFTWGEGDIIIEPAKWGLSYKPDPKGNRVVLVQDLEELVIHLRQKYPKQDLQDALETFLKSDVARHMPAGLRAELEDAWLI